jgi:DNA-binding transcriptional LysR family regulator
MGTAVPWDDRVRRRFKLRELDIFMAVLSAGSMGKAAVRLNMAQPAVSKAVSDLEHMLGVRLLDRSSQGVEPTAHGSALFKRGMAVFDELRQGVQELDFLSDVVAGELRIGCTDTISNAIVTPLVLRLTEQYPRIVFHVDTRNPPLLGRELAGRNVELAISRVTPPTEPGESIEILFEDRVVVVTGKKNPLTRRHKITLADLINEPWVVFDSVLWKRLTDSFNASGLAPPHISVVTHSINLHNELAASGRFLTLVPSYVLKLPRSNPLLRALPLTLPNSRHPIGIRTLQNRSLSPLAQLFIERIRAFTKPLATSEAS